MWDSIKNTVFNCIEFFANIIGDWGLAIIIITIIFRLLVAPIIHKQIQSSYQMKKVQPIIREIRQRFANDPMRINKEMQKLYADMKFNPLTGCLPVLLQIPIFLAMFQTLREIGIQHPDRSYTFYLFVSDLTKTPVDVFSQGFLMFLPYLILMLIFSVFTLLPMILKNLENDDPQRNLMLIMSGVTLLFMLWISWRSPAGVLLFWGTSSAIGILQEQFTIRALKKNEEEMIKVNPVKMEVERKVKKKRPTKS